MDAVSGIVTVIELCTIVCNYVTQVAGASEVIKTFQSKVEFCKSILSTLEKEPDEEDRRNDWTETIRILNEPGAPLSCLKEILTSVQKKLGSATAPRTGVRRTVQTLIWPFNEKQVQKLLESIQDHVQLLEVALLNDQRKLLLDIQKYHREHGQDMAELLELIQQQAAEVNGKLDDTRRVQDEAERQCVLDWLTATNYGSRQSDWFNRRQPGTGSWFFEEPAFIDWKQNRGKVLFCPGMPGAGKTILTSVVIDHLVTTYSSESDVLIAYVFIEFRRKEEQTLNELLASLLKQLLQTQQYLPPNVEKMYELHKDRGTRPSTAEVSEALVVTVTLAAKVFILVDGLDECGDGRGPLLQSLFGLRDTHAINMMATSRAIPEIVLQFEEHPKVEIRASEDDIRRYLDEYLKAHISRLPRYLQKSQELQLAVKEVITEAADGMFLLAHLYIESIQHKMTKGDLKAALEDFRERHNRLREYQPKRRADHKQSVLSQAYNEVMRRIGDQGPERRALGMQALSWIAFANRPLSEIELRHAIATTRALELHQPELEGEDAPELDEDYIPETEDIVNVCAGIVTVDEQSHVVRLVHYTTQEYFDRTQSQWFPDAQETLLRSCMYYMSLGFFSAENLRFYEEQQRQAKEEFDEKVRMAGPKGLVTHKRDPDLTHLYPVISLRYPFCSYVTDAWPYHARRAPSIFSHVVAFLQSSREMLTCYEREVGVGDVKHNTVTGLHLAAIHGLLDVVEALVQRLDCLNPTDYFGRMPLMYAVHMSRTAVVRLLLETGRVDVLYNYKGIAGEVVAYTILSYAASRADAETVKAILDTAKLGPDTVNIGNPIINVVTSYSRGNLHAESVLQMLLDAGVDPNLSTNVMGRDVEPPLIYVSTFGHWRLAALLLRHDGINVNSRSDRGETALVCACRRVERPHRIVELLLAHPAVNPDLPDDTGRTPLSYAADQYYPPEDKEVTTVSMLLACPAVHTDSRGIWGRTPLMYASRQRAWTAHLLLAADGVCPHKRDAKGRSALAYAAERGNVSLVRCLLQFDSVDAAETDVFSRSPLWYAARSFADPDDRENIVRLLLSVDGVDVNGKDMLGITPLLAAAICGNFEVVRLLLGCSSIDPNPTDILGRYTVGLAAARGRLDIVELVRGKLAMSRMPVPADVAAPESTITKSWDRCMICLEEMSSVSSWNRCRKCDDGPYCGNCFKSNIGCLVGSDSTWDFPPSDIVSLEDRKLLYRLPDRT